MGEHCRIEKEGDSLRGKYEEEKSNPSSNPTSLLIMQLCYIKLALLYKCNICFSKLRIIRHFS